MSGPTLESGSWSVPRPDLEFRADVGPHTRVWIPECAETRSGVQSRCLAPHLSSNALSLYSFRSYSWLCQVS